MPTKQSTDKKGEKRGPLKLKGARTKFEKKTLTPSQQRYLKRQSSDPYTKKALGAGYRSRAAYKLLEIMEKFPQIFKNANTIVDLGCAPGGWLQVVQEVKPHAKLIGLDLLEIDPMENIRFYKGDFSEGAALDWLLEQAPKGVNVVLSDMAPNTIGHTSTDHLRSMALVELAVDFALNNLQTGGYFVSKIFQGGQEQALMKDLRQQFQKVTFVKPASSRKESREQFLVALGFKGSA